MQEPTITLRTGVSCGYSEQTKFLKNRRFSHNFHTAMCVPYSSMRRPPKGCKTTHSLRTKEDRGRDEAKQRNTARARNRLKAAPMQQRPGMVNGQLNEKSPAFSGAFSLFGSGTKGDFRNRIARSFHMVTAYDPLNPPAPAAQPRSTPATSRPPARGRPCRSRAPSRSPRRAPPARRAHRRPPCARPSPDRPERP